MVRAFSREKAFQLTLTEQSAWLHYRIATEEVVCRKNLHKKDQVKDCGET